MKSKVRSFTKLRAKSRALEAARAAHQRLIAELQRTQAELARALTLRDEFMVMVTHELRTPLGVMALEVMLRQQRLAKGDLAWFSPERLQSMLDKDGRQVRSMTRLIEDMLDVSRLQHGMLSAAAAPTWPNSRATWWPTSKTSTDRCRSASSPGPASSVTGTTAASPRCSSTC